MFLNLEYLMYFSLRLAPQEDGQKSYSLVVRGFYSKSELAKIVIFRHPHGYTGYHT